MLKAKVLDFICQKVLEIKCHFLLESTCRLQISENMYVGGVAAAVLTKKGNIYTGVCIDTSSSLGMCAERNALSTMIANGENEVDKVLSVYKDGTVMPPCGACREFMMQLGTTAKKIQILIDNRSFQDKC